MGEVCEGGYNPEVPVDVLLGIRIVTFAKHNVVLFLKAKASIM